jgi:hypothetical protein
MTDVRVYMEFHINTNASHRIDALLHR